MRKKTTVTMILVMTFFIILLAAIAGCSSQAPPASPVPVNNLSTIEPSIMALQLADLPGNFTVLESADRTRSEMRQWSLDHGWKKGYNAVFQKNDSASVTVVSQYISIYPYENMSIILQDTTMQVKNWSDENVSVDEISPPVIGDSRNAFKISDKGSPIQDFVIVFVKKDVYEELSVNGTIADYDVLRQLADIAAAKIK
jgi:hypothetical protein